jgi:hypothetical protein
MRSFKLFIVGLALASLLLAALPVEAQQVIVRNRGVFGRRQNVVVNNGFGAQQVVVNRGFGFRRRNVVVNNFGFAQPAFVAPSGAFVAPFFVNPYGCGVVQSFGSCGF